MADAAKTSPRSSGDSMKTMQALGVVLIVVLGIFMVTSLNKVNAELIKMNSQVNVLVTSTAQSAIGSFQAVDGAGQLQWKFAPVPMATMAAGAMGSCPAGEKCGAAGATGETCAASGAGTAGEKCSASGATSGTCPASGTGAAGEKCSASSATGGTCPASGTGAAAPAGAAQK